MTKLSPRLEAIVTELCNVSGEGDMSVTECQKRWSAITNGLNEDDFDAVTTRAGVIMDARAREAEADAEPAIAEADASVRLVHLMRALGCPPDVPVMPWLEDRGVLARNADGNYSIQRPTPSSDAEFVMTLDDCWVLVGEDGKDFMSGPPERHGWVDIERALNARGFWWTLWHRLPRHEAA